MSPSYPIVFYISGHGFGHASRSIEVIEELRRRRPSTPLVVKTAAAPRIFERTLDGAVELIRTECDAGMVQKDSLNIDVDESLRRARAFQNRLGELIDIEAAFLRERKARLVVGDIPPLAFAAAATVGVPSIAIGNFTWDWIYESYPGLADVADGIRALYRKATNVLRLPMAGGFDGLESVREDIPFIARRSRHEPEAVRRMLSLGSRDKDGPLVLMSFGSYGVKRLNTEAISGLKGYVIVTNDRISGLRHVSDEQLSAAGLRYEDVVRAADVVVTKPGYGIISEAIANDTALVYTSRGHFVEYDVLVKEMPRYLRAQFISRDDFLSGNWRPALEALSSSPAPPEAPRVDGAAVAADRILSFDLR